MPARAASELNVLGGNFAGNPSASMITVPALIMRTSYVFNVIRNPVDSVTNADIAVDTSKKSVMDAHPVTCTLPL